MMYSGLDALARGATVALAAALPGLLLAWLATVPMRDGSRALRALVIAVATLGVMMAAAGAVALGMEQRDFADDLLGGALMAGGAAAAVLFLLLLLILPRRRS
jgi:hypothetical protein